MSGLEKFKASEDWRTNFKKFLFMNRKPEVFRSTTITERQRYSLDIGEDLKNLIEQKKNQQTVNLEKETGCVKNDTTKIYEQAEPTTLKKDINGKENMNRYDESVYEEVPRWQRTTEESFEALEKMCEKTASDPNNTLFKYLNGEEEQKDNNVLVWQKTSDESFEALERMCDKTASDPNSTLFQYLHSDRKEQVLAKVKKRSAEGEILNDNAEGQLLIKMNNCTLLDDIEAPSRMWENSICGDTILQTSPVKMVGLLRPSTIMEEAADDSKNSDISSHFSFRTATKSVHSDVSSSAYETAHDSTDSSHQPDFLKKTQNKNLGEMCVEEDLLNVRDKKDQGEETIIIPCVDVMDDTIVEAKALTKESDDENNPTTSNLSLDLIDFEKTFGPLHCCQNSPGQNKGISRSEEPQNIECYENDLELESETDSYNALDESVIEILSDDEEDVVETVNDVDQCEANNHTIKSEPISNSVVINSDIFRFNASDENDKENSFKTNEELEKSMQFNDTMEEVEYLLKRGMEYMAAEAASKKSPEKLQIPALSICNRKDGVSQSESPMKDLKAVKHTTSSTSKEKSSTYGTPAAKIPLTKSQNSASKRFDIDIKPFPKLEIFAKPCHTRTKELASKQQKFSHIISPIGTYMKKTAKTPLMSSMHCKTKNYFNSTAILELENESRLYQPIFSTDSKGNEAVGLSILPGLIPDVKRPLPKKAYISSDLKHIVDERTPITIPGSKQIQKYLENAMMPAVLRHEGKFKVPGGINKLNTSTSLGASPKLPLKESDRNSCISKPTAQVLHRNNASLADLSLMSGDVSMYTIMDAQKF